MVNKKEAKEQNKDDKERAEVPKSIVVLEKPLEKKKKKKLRKKKKKKSAADAPETTAESILGDVNPINNLEVAGEANAVDTIKGELVKKLSIEDGETGVDRGWDMTTGAEDRGRGGEEKNDVAGTGGRREGDDDKELLDLMLN